jgi:signal transduction histidine kinase
MSCRLKSGRIIVRDILPSVVQIGGKAHILATIHDASQRQLTELLRSGAHFVRFSNAVAAGAASTPSVEHALRFCLRQICDYFHWVFAHSHIFCGRVLSARVPRDIWHFGLHDLAGSVQALVGAKQFFFPEEWYSHILAGPQAIMVNDFDSQPESLVKLEVQSAGLSSALVMPILVDGEVAGVCQYFSDQPMDRGPLFLNTMNSLTARLGQIIEQKLADETVRRLSNRLFRIQDEERRLLARELHDTTAQNIAAILMDLGVIGRSADVLTPEARHALSESLSLTRQSLQEIRSFSYLIHPPMLDELGLVSALRIFIEGFSQRSGMHVHLEAPVSPKLPTQLESTVFRVIQEALTNARRHSGSSTADVKLRTTETELKLSVENETARDLLWGQPDIQPAKIGVGMRSMHERVQHVGGRLDFHIGKNRTVLEAVFPLS